MEPVHTLCNTMTESNNGIYIDLITYVIRAEEIFIILLFRTVDEGLIVSANYEIDSKSNAGKFWKSNSLLFTLK